MKNMFYGNEICCGSYACLNAMKNEKIPWKLFEISASVPFGVMHMEDGTFDRLLTTYCNPNIGIDRAVPLWGYEQEKREFSDADAATAYLKKKLPESPAVLGPVDMKGLYYLPFSYLYRRMDHYVSMEETSDHKIRCVDSEGVNGYPLEYEQLPKLMQTENLPEASGKICIRSFVKKKEYDRTEILAESLKHACRNLCDAEHAGHGPRAYRECFIYLADQNVKLWKLPLLYDLNYLIQRKLLLILLLEELGKERIMDSILLDRIKALTEKQLKLFAVMVGKLRQTDTIEKEDFDGAADCEEGIREGMVEIEVQVTTATKAEDRRNEI